MTATFISSTAPNFNQPIADLVVKLARRDPGNLDQDYIYPAILLTVARFEAFMVRALYLAKFKGTPAATADDLSLASDQTARTGRHIMQECFPGYGAAGLDRLDEAYVLRDVITHNHLWEYRILDDGSTQHIRRLFGGNKNYIRSVDFDARPIATKILKLPVVPGEQDRRSLKLVYSELAAALDFAEESLKARGERLTGSQRARIPQELSASLFGHGAGLTVELNDLVAAMTW